MTTKLITAALLAAAAYGQVAQPGTAITEYVACPGDGTTSAVLCVNEPIEWSTDRVQYVPVDSTELVELSITTERPKTITVTATAPRFRIQANGSEAAVITYEIEPYYDHEGRLALRLLPINRSTDQPINRPTDQPINRP